jgi:exonuclease III
MADKLINILQMANLQLLSRPGAITWEARGSRSTLDLVFGSDLALDRLLECEVKLDMDHGSDHLPVATTLSLSAQTAPPRRSRNWKKMDTRTIKVESLNLRRLEIECPSPTQLEEYTDYLMTFIQNWINITVPWSQPSNHASPWWTQEIKNLAREEQQARRRWVEYGNEQARRQRIEISKKKKNMIKWEKRKTFREEVHKASKTQEGIWRLARYARLKGVSTPELSTMSTLRIDNDLAMTLEKKEKALWRRFFPNSIIKIDNINNSNFED